MEQPTLNKILTSAIHRSMTYADYSKLLATCSAEGKTTGPKQSEALIYFTNLNHRRSLRVEKTVQLSEAAQNRLKAIREPQTWLLITETWCGDAASSVPVIAKMAQANPKISLKLVLRDEDTTLIDQFLTNGGRSIPKLVVLNAEMDVLFTWGPRPEGAQAIYTAWREQGDGRPDYTVVQEALQKWYNKNKGHDLQQEIMDMIESALSS